MPRFDLTDPELDHLLRWVQQGVVSRRQLLGLGATDNDIERMVRRRELTVAHPGVYVAHTGPLSMRQREWVAVLSAWPAALARESALPDPPTAVVHVAIGPGRKLVVPDRVRPHRTADLDNRVNWRAGPPCVWIERALVDVMSARIADDDIAGAFATSARVAHTRLTTADRALATLASRERVAGRRTIEGLLTDLRDGVCSVLERGYLYRVERAHGLPRGRRQPSSTATGRRTDQDVRYPRYGVIVELDGQAFHDSPEARDRDALRDLAELATNRALTTRVTYGLVFREQCRTAAWIAALLRRRGWSGEPRRCPSCPPDRRSWA